MQLYTGTSGWAYKEWKGPLLPREAQERRHARATTRSGCRRSRSTTPSTACRRRARSRSGATQVSPRLPLRAQGAAAHHAPQRLTDADSLAFLLDAADTSSAARSAPSCSSSRPSCARTSPRLRDFLALLPPGCPAAFEFRHASWFDDEVYAALRDARRRAVHRRERRGRSTRRSFRPPAGAICGCGARTTTTPMLERWAARLREQPWSRAFVFFKHEDAGAGPRLAARFREIYDNG